ncbi:hypothetical protein NP537_10380 [Pseudomonas kurunegalensis]|nr:hypothetical protein [Pseudomonas kurunegalensis]
MTLITLTQIQLTAKRGELDARGRCKPALARNQQPITARLATGLGLLGSEVAQCHLKQRLFFIDHLGEVRAYRLAVDHRLATAFQKLERASIAAKPVTFVKGLVQARRNKAVDTFDTPQQRIDLLTAAKAVRQCLADLRQLPWGYLTQPERQALADDAVLERIDGCLCA